MILPQEAEIKLTKYKGLNYGNQSVMQVSAVPHSEMLTYKDKVVHMESEESNKI